MASYGQLGLGPPSYEDSVLFEVHDIQEDPGGGTADANGAPAHSSAAASSSSSGQLNITVTDPVKKVGHLIFDDC
jgi:hypothetical protein